MFSDLADLIHDPDFASKYQVIRREGDWEAGRFKLHDPITLQYYGPVQPAQPKELQAFPEGERNKGIFKFKCKMPRKLYTTSANSEHSGVSDEVIWRKERYKILSVLPWNHLGWMTAFGCLLDDEEENEGEEVDDGNDE